MRSFRHKQTDVSSNLSFLYQTIYFPAMNFVIFAKRKFIIKIKNYEVNIMFGCMCFSYGMYRC